MSVTPSMPEQWSKNCHSARVGELSGWLPVRPWRVLLLRQVRLEELHLGKLAPSRCRIHDGPPDCCRESAETECHNYGAIWATVCMVSIRMDCEKIRARNKAAG
jgi:hypothetical protein